jgi:hypothetical protein
MALVISGTPFVGYLSLTNGAIGPTAFTLFTVMGKAAYTLQSTERLYITNITISSNDTTQALVTVDTGGSTPTKLASTYLSTSQPPAVENIPLGACKTIFGTVPRGTASAVTSTKTVEFVIKGLISQS